MKKPRSSENSRTPHPLHPGNWGQGLGVVILWLIGQLPWRRALGIGEAMGQAGYRLAHHRRAIARRNLELCFPDLEAAAREALLKENFRYTGRGLAELALAWFGSSQVDHIPFEIQGLEHVRAVEAQGRPIIFLSGHFTSLEIIARLIKPVIPFAVIYKPPRRKPLLSRAMYRARMRIATMALSHTDVRGIIRCLKGGTPVWFAGDQNFSHKESVFAPFFGVPAATITALTRLTRLSNARVIPVFFHSKPGHAGYTLILEPALDDFPGVSALLDAERMNACIESAVRHHPAQYLWIHRRFKRQQQEGMDLYASPPRTAPSTQGDGHG